MNVMQQALLNAGVVEEEDIERTKRVERIKKEKERKRRARAKKAKSVPHFEEHRELLKTIVSASIRPTIEKAIGGIGVELGDYSSDFVDMVVDIETHNIIEKSVASVLGKNKF